MILDNCARGPVDGPRGHEGRRAHCTTPAAVASLAVLLAFSAPAALADAPHWSTRFAFPGLSRQADALLTWRGQLVALGDFHSADGDPTFGAAAWDGARWTSLTRDLVALDASESYAHFDAGIVWEGNLVARGRIDARTAAGDTLHDLGLYDGATWRAMPQPGSSGYVRGFAVFRDRLFAFGSFVAGDYWSGTRFAVAEWDAALGAWTPRDPLPAGGYSYVSNLVATPDSLYARGGFDADGMPQEYLRVFDGDAWRSVAPTAAGSPQPNVSFVAAYHGALLSIDVRYDSTTVGVVQRWNGTGWDELASVVPWDAYDIYTSDDSLFVVGSRGDADGATGIARRWDGARFVDAAALPRPFASAIGVFAGQVIASGSWSGSAVTGEATLACEGAAWHSLTGLRGALGLPTGVSSIVVRDGAPWCATNGATEGVPVAVWTGSGWATAAGAVYAPPSDFLDRSPSMLVSAPAGIAWVERYMSDGAVRVWNGERLALLPKVSPRLFALAPYRGSWIAGGYEPSSLEGSAMGNVARWDGAQWVSLGHLPGVVRALREFGGVLYAGGAFLRTSDAPGDAALAAWDGAAWRARGEVLLDGDGTSAGEVECLGAWRGALVVGGSFNRVAPGVHAANVALWDGARWSECGSGVNGTVTAVGVYHGDLVVGGRFTRAGSVEARGIARWDGVQWRPFGEGIDGGDVRSLVSWRNVLIAGGDFTRAGGAASSHVAMWEGEAGVPDDSVATTDPAALDITAPSSGVVSTSAIFSLRLSAATHVRAWMLDAAGRTVRRVLDAPVDAGPHSLAWPGDTDDGRRAPSGLYWLRVETTQTHLERRVVVIR